MVVKSYSPTSDGAEGFITESAGREFSAGLAQAPDLLATDPGNLLVVISDLGIGPSLADVLVANSAPAARAALLGWAHNCALTDQAAPPLARTQDQGDSRPARGIVYPGSAGAR